MAYLIVTYDIGEERVEKVRKILKKYLSWVQNSVFEGDIGEGKLKQCEQELLDIIDEEYDSIYFYRLENRLNQRRKTIGVVRESTGNVL